MMGGRKDICGARRGTSFEARKWLSLDVCGSIGITLSFSVHIFAFGVIIYYLIAFSLLSTAVFLLLYMPVFLLALVSLFMAWTSDPGSVPIGARPLVTVKRASSVTLNGGNSNDGNIGSNKRNRALRRCHKCNDNFKPSRAHHDSVTGRCIVKFDHFCPWVGNAVGAMNHKFFVLFVGYTMLSCFFSLCLIGLRTLYCGLPLPLSNGRNEENETLEHTEECTGWNESWAGLILLVISVVFFLFTSCMFVEQIEAIKTNASKIARMKMSVGLGGTELQRVTEEFNEMFGGDSNQVALHWFIPFPIEFPQGMKKAVLGYDWDETFDAIPYQERGDVEMGSPQLTTALPAVSSNDNQDNGHKLDTGKYGNDSPLSTLERPQLVKRSSRDYDQDPLRSENTLT